VLVRAGHTEAGCDLAAMAGYTPAAVICEIMKDDGTMARLPDLKLFAAEHGLKIGTIADLIAYRSQNESLVQLVGERVMRTPHGEFRARLYRDKPSSSMHMALARGDITAEHETLVRVHEPLSMLDLLETSITTHSWSLHAALKRMGEVPRSVMVLLNCQESADELAQQFVALDGGTVDRARANRMDLRTYGIGAQILRAEGVRKMRLLANARKMPSMQGFGLDVVGFDGP
jgi:3,4-dihydroxy 2-butanone 4-phosphate synthase/GTP cyclohydrolase II